MVLKTTSLIIDSEIMKQIKIVCAKKEMNQTELIKEYLIKGLKDDGININFE